VPRQQARREPLIDLVVIGGGVNGAAIARDAAGRGLAVMLCEKDDLAAATSSRSSKLVHGGLRYLEHCEFRLVREALAEREVLLRMAPHLVWPMRFVLPHDPNLRPRWLIRAGLFLYDHLGRRRTLPASRAVRLSADPLGAPLQRRAVDGFVYSDCWVQDARLVALLARDAAARGAEILTRTALVDARRERGGWRLELARPDGSRDVVRARILVNAAGPWVPGIMRLAGLRSDAAERLVKGSHIVVPRLYEGDQAHILQNDDRRIVFVLPFERDFTLIGTTELPFEGDPGDVQTSAEETEYLCRAVSRWFRNAVSPGDVVWSYAGVRPLYDDHAGSAAAVTRDYVLELDAADGAPALSVFGGKITTHRRLAEHALLRLQPWLPGAGPLWTAGSLLPGGEGMPEGGPAALAAELRRDYPFLNDPERFARAYGSEARALLGAATSPAELGRDFGSGLYEAEIRWLVEREWAQTADDILWRRTKLGLVAAPDTASDLSAYLARPIGVRNRSAAAAAPRGSC
jgi:glycerol-3-phosphate dehydrogenase